VTLDYPKGGELYRLVHEIREGKEKNRGEGGDDNKQTRKEPGGSSARTQRSFEIGGTTPQDSNQKVGGQGLRKNLKFRHRGTAT